MQTICATVRRRHAVFEPRKEATARKYHFVANTSEWPLAVTNTAASV